MPVSSVASISPIMAEVVRLQPKSVLDLGCGVGKYAVLCREVLDGVYGRVKPKDWKAHIAGVEGFEAYRNPVWGAYSVVFVENFVDYSKKYAGYGLVLMIDSLEHLDEMMGKVVLRQLVCNNDYVIVSVPLGVCPQGAEFGNEYERHRTTFTGVEQFRDYNYRVLHKGECLVLSISGVRG